jgi:hypothetical protein
MFTLSPVSPTNTKNAQNTPIFLYINKYWKTRQLS